jgi:hypothetical protein
MIGCARTVGTENRQLTFTRVMIGVIGVCRTCTKDEKTFDVR